MKTISVRQPWAALIASGVKTIENRSWAAIHRGPIAIHAGKAPAPTNLIESLTSKGYRIPQLRYGKILAVATLTDCMKLEDLPSELRYNRFAEGEWCWILKDVKAIDPIPYKGKLGLFDVPDSLFQSQLHVAPVNERITDTVG